jgi:hypothetical protein
LKFAALLRGIAAVGPHQIWAVGQRYGRTNPFGDTDGTRWTIVPSPDPGGASQDNDLWDVAAVTTGDIWTVGGVGSFLNPQSSSPLALHWDGSSWMQASVPAPAVGELLAAAADPPGPGFPRPVTR